MMEKYRITYKTIRKKVLFLNKPGGLCQQGLLSVNVKRVQRVTRQWITDRTELGRDGESPFT